MGLVIMEVLGVLTYAGCQSSNDKSPEQKLPPYKVVGGGAPGNSPVKIVGGSMTFRAPGGWTVSNGGATWTTTNSVSVSAIELERVWASGGSGEPTDIIFGVPSSSWKIELDGRDPTGARISSGNGSTPNGVIVSPSGNFVQIAPTNTASATYGFYSVPVGSTLAPDAPTWDKTLYPGVRYKDQSGSASPKCSDPGAKCESIWQIQVTLNGTAHIFQCPDGECRVYLLPPPPA